jgi:translocation and assembly module TamB
MKRMLWRAALALTVLLTVASLASWLTIRSNWFYQQVRQRIVYEMEKATGGRAELGGYRFDWRTMRAEVTGVVLHGLEPAGSNPLFRAERVTLGLRLVSVLRRKVDLLSLQAERPLITLLIDEHGRTNLPEPKVKRQGGKPGLEQFVDLAVREYRLNNGEFTYNDRRIPLHAAGRDLSLQLSYDAGARAYQGQLRSAAVQLAQPVRTKAALSVDTLWTLTENELRFQRAALELDGAKAILEGTVTPLTAAARVDGRGTLDAPVSVIAGFISLPVASEGRARVSGRFSRDAAKLWNASGTITAQGMRYAQTNLNIPGVALESNWQTDFQNIRLGGLRVRALNGEFRGEAQVNSAVGIHVKGQVEGVALDRVLAARQIQAEGYSGTVSGAVELFTKEKRATADLSVSGEQNVGGVAGRLTLSYDDAAGQLDFAPSHISLAHSRVNFGGDPGKRMQVGLISSNLDDFLPLLRASGASSWNEMPVKLANGQLRFDGAVTGALDQPAIAGRLEAGPLYTRGQRVESITGNLELSKDRLRLTGLRAAANGTAVSGQVSAVLADWSLTDASLVSGHLDASGAKLADLLRQARQDIDASGLVNASLDLEGTLGSPRVSARATVRGLAAWGETFDSLDADVRYSASRTEVSNGRVVKGAASIRFSGAIERGEDIEFQVDAANWRLQQWEFMKRQPARLDGSMALRITGTARRTPQRIQLSSLNGAASVDKLTVNERTVGKADVAAETRGRTMSVKLEAHLPNSEIVGTAEWSLGGNSFGLGQIRIPRLTFADLKELGFLGEPDKELAFRGEIQGEIGFSGPVLQPDKWTGVAKITRLEVEPVRGLPGAQSVDPSRLLLRNRDPLIAQVDASAITLQAVHLVAEGTDLEVLGAIGLKTRNPWDLQIKGSLNLPSLSTFEPDLVATGVSVIDATVRGSYERPQLMGRMELRNASFRLRDIPNGLTRANGVIVFDRTRANIESFAAQTGGGELRVTGFVGLAGPELLYRLQANLQQVRVRYPDQVSTTFNGSLNLTGTATQSLLSGTATVIRVAMNPQADIGSLLQQSSAKSTPPQSGFLRGMQLDLRVETSPDAELQTSLTRDLQPEAELRVRGSFVKPVLLGRVSVNQGEINFFGNRYVITRGEVSFFNTAKVEPVLDLDLETRVRGITVTINFTGPIDKLAVSYRSDPPLQSTEIVALLTVGRAPGAGITSNTPSRNQGYLQSGGNSLLGQAISTPVTGRLERLFGVSRIKIDPDLTGVTNTAQTRLTVEQQLSRDITITYITNLNRTQQQIVRLQWDFSKDFSLLAVRDENGIFGVDFLWRRRFR